MLLVFVKMESVIIVTLFVLTCTGIYSYPRSDKTSPYCFDYNFNDDSEYKQYLSDEMKKDGVFKRVWNSKDLKKPNRYTENEIRALWTYTGPYVSKKFNKATRDLVDGITKYEKYQYKALHYYLSSAIQKSKSCHSNIYRGSTDTETSFKVGDTKFKFKQFTSSSLLKERSDDFLTPTGTFFTISTCAGAYIAKYSRYQEEKEVLIPPCAEFTVTKVTDATSSEPRSIVLNGGDTKNALNGGKTFRKVTITWSVVFATSFLIQLIGKNYI